MYVVNCYISTAEIDRENCHTPLVVRASSLQVQSDPATSWINSLIPESWNMAEEKHHHHLFHHHKDGDDSPNLVESVTYPQDDHNYEKEEKHHKHKQHVGEMGAVAAGAFALVITSIINFWNFNQYWYVSTWVWTQEI